MNFRFLLFSQITILNRVLFLKFKKLCFSFRPVKFYPASDISFWRQSVVFTFFMCQVMFRPEFHFSSKLMELLTRGKVTGRKGTLNN